MYDKIHYKLKKKKLGKKKKKEHGYVLTHNYLAKEAVFKLRQPVSWVELWNIFYVASFTFFFFFLIPQFLKKSKISSVSGSLVAVEWGSECRSAMSNSLWPHGL